MPVGRLQSITAILMAYAVLLILVSPVVPSPLTMVRSKQNVHPPQFTAPISALLFTSAIELAVVSLLLDTEHNGIFSSGLEIIDLTTARLC